MAGRVCLGAVLGAAAVAAAQPRSRSAAAQPRPVAAPPASAPPCCATLRRDVRARGAYDDDMVTYKPRGAAAVTEEVDETRKTLIAATRRIRDLGAGGDALGAVQALAALGKSGIVPDVQAVTATLVRLGCMRMKRAAGPNAFCASQRACIACNDLPRAQRVFDDLVGTCLFLWVAVARRCISTA